jgi:hypothetical protein
LKTLTSSLLSVCTLAVLSSACLKLEGTKAKKSSSQAVVASAKVDQMIGSGENQYRVVSENLLRKENLLKTSHPKASAMLGKVSHLKTSLNITLPNSEASDENSLVVGMPIGLIGQQSVFGGVFTKVSDKEREDLGGLKLTDLTPLHVRTMVVPDNDGNHYLALMGCIQSCDERAKQQILMTIPILGVDQEKKLVMLDLKSIGQGLSLISMNDPNGENYKLKALSSATTLVDYDDISTLIFDIKTNLVPLDSKEGDENVKVTEITTRWYLKLASGFSSSFESRLPTEGVGFFQTERAKVTRITRFDMTEDKAGPILYYGKNIPKAFQPHFAKAFAKWNAKLKEILGRSSDVIELKMVEKSDPLYSILVPGDVRFNIIEWDLDNKASYGGLGPSMANQFTGETMSANILIQGPTVVDLYTKWFGVSERARDYQEQGLLAEADLEIKKFHDYANSVLAKKRTTDFTVKLGNLSMNVHSQNEELEDPIYKGHFEIVPEGMTFDSYMEGYFMDMVQHELGHNLGLRHNFRGNLGAADEDMGRGFVSRSIMEYLGRPYRYRTELGLYDKMAIAYGYLGTAPTHKDWFCTDENQAADLDLLNGFKDDQRKEVLDYIKQKVRASSAECSKNDATSDPFSFWEGRLSRTLDLLLNRKSSEAPIFKIDDTDVKDQINQMIMAFANYALSADATADSWTNFFGKGDRPEKKEEVRAYVLSKMKAQLCAPEISEIISAKANDEAKKAAQENYEALLKKIVDSNNLLEGFTADELKCQ